MGRPVYAEGCDFPYFNQSNALWPSFGATYVARGSLSGNCTTLNGQPGTFAEGLSFGYATGGPDMYVNTIGSAGGTIFLKDQATRDRAIFHTPGVARTMCSAVIFGAFTPTDDRADLMTAYLNYLLHGVPLPEASPASSARLAAAPNPATRGRTIRFSVPEGTRRLEVLDACGRRTCDLGSAATWDLVASNGQPVVPGTYILRAVGRASTATLPFVVCR